MEIRYAVWYFAAWPVEQLRKVIFVSRDGGREGWDRRNMEVMEVVNGICCCCLFTLSCPTLCNPMDCSPPGSSIHGILQARILEWVAISFSRGSSWPWNWTQSPALQADSLPLSHQGSLSGGYQNTLNPHYLRIVHKTIRKTKIRIFQ